MELGWLLGLGRQGGGLGSWGVFGTVAVASPAQQPGQGQPEPVGNGPSILVGAVAQPILCVRDVNGSDTDGYCRYCICFHIFYRIRIRTRIVSDTNTDSNCFGYKYE